jgi:hypothetical protein
MSSSMGGRFWSGMNPSAVLGRGDSGGAEGKPDVEVDGPARAELGVEVGLARAKLDVGVDRAGELGSRDVLDNWRGMEG